MNEWISISDRLPDPYEAILISCPHPFVQEHVGWMNHDKTFRSMFVLNLKNVTHWASFTRGPNGPFGVTEAVDREYQSQNSPDPRHPRDGAEKE